MRPLPFLSGILLSLTTPAFAQVTLDLHALQALPERHAPQRTTARSAQHQTERTATITPRSETAASRSVPGEASSPKVAVPAAASAAATAPSAAVPSVTVPPTASRPAASTPPAPAVPPALPQAEPQTAMITPIAPAPPSAGSAPPPPPVSDNAATNAAPTVSGLRITFASGQSDLSPESVAAIKQLASATPSGDTTSFNVLAYAPGSQDDPSTARRVSLSRAMAVRSALVADGVSSARIYVRALGAQYGNGPADRVDVNVTGGADAGSAAAQATPK